ncbi:MAG TPA: hypothetical protein VN228_06530, partial [Pyrinomonadaceae bacterium]|nr:hypothetical protein [Pyrinomonadaceae bacterium]
GVGRRLAPRRVHQEQAARGLDFIHSGEAALSRPSDAKDGAAAGSVNSGAGRGGAGIFLISDFRLKDAGRAPRRRGSKI